jgi:hypothetical protein
MRNLLALFIVIASVSGCMSTKDKAQQDATDPYAGWPSFLASSAGHEVMMKMIHRRPKTGNFGAIGG